MNIIGTVIRSILYKIPLKLLLILVAVFGILFACFSSALTIVPDYTTDFSFYHRAGSNNPVDISPNVSGITCVEIDDYANSSYYLDDGNDRYYFDNNWQIYCSDSMSLSLYINTSYYYWFFFSEDLFRQFFPNYTSLECQTEYNLIPISSVDSAYCEENNLCSSSDCPGSDLTPGVSNIFINDIFHPGAYNIIMNIPEEIDRDYTYTNSGSNFNLDVVGYNQDEEYIQSVIDVQNYKPTSEDFTRVFSNISNFGALLIACLFVILVFYMIKKAFK